MEDTEQVRQLVCTRIGEIENQVKCLQALRKSLLEKAYEVKQSILSSFVQERETSYNKEMSLLSEVDSLHHSKDDAVVTQLNKLNQVLGCLRNCLESPHPCGDCLEKFEDIDMLSVEEVDMEFTSANQLLTNSRTSARPTQNQVICADDSMTKWLMTPTNNHTDDDGVKDTGSAAFTTTEWLIQYHSHAKPAMDTGNHFLYVKSAKHDDWLKDGTRVTSSLYNYALNNFEAIIGETHQAWLQKSDASSLGRDRTMSDSCSESSITTSSISSSCVIIPSVTSSNDSEPHFETSSKTDELREMHSQSPFEVDEWVAKCDSSDDWLVSTRPRLMSAGYTDMQAVPITPTHNSGWLVRSDAKPESEYMSTDGSDWLKSTPSSSTLPSMLEDLSQTTTVTQTDMQMWLPVLEKKMEAFCAEYADEKLDVSFEKSPEDEWLVKVTVPEKGTEDGWKMEATPNKRDEWLSGTATSPFSVAKCGQNDWLSGEEKKDESAKSSKLLSHDREWLLVINQMNKISSSAMSGWLASNVCSTPVTLPSIYNETSTEKLTNWLR